jgi:hypothetical protein
MTTRMTSKTVTFRRPFILDGFGEVQAPGTYTVETEEEQLDTASVTTAVWKRTCTIIHLTKGTAIEYRQIDPEELNKALLRDDAQPGAASSPGATASPRAVRRKKF